MVSRRPHRLSPKPKQRILQIAHNHPSFSPGGTEIFARALHREALRRGCDSWFLGAMADSDGKPYPGAYMRGLSADQRESALYFPLFDNFALSQADYFGFLREFKDYLLSIKPDVVHFHHILNFGLEALHLVRNTLPDCRIVLTLHDYYLICPNYGFLYKFTAEARCEGPELAQCMKCLPKRSAVELGQRKLDVQYALMACDAIVSPSVFLRDKMIRHLGVDHISVIENGSVFAKDDPLPSTPLADDFVSFGYFGNLTQLKGILHLLDAVDMLEESMSGRFTLTIFGSQLYKDEVIASRMRDAKIRHGNRIRLQGRYEPEDIGRLFAGIDCVVFPSIWWENAPLVLYEALAAAKPVISYAGGGAEEILSRYRAGILATELNPQALAAAMKTVLETRSDIAPPPDVVVPSIDVTFARYLEIYAP